MTVLDTSGVIDFLIGGEAFEDVADLLGLEATAVPELLTFEVVAVLRRQVVHHGIDAERAKSAVDDLADLPLEIYPTLPLRFRAWELRHNFTAADGFFVSLAEQLDAPFATKDRPLASAVLRHTNVPVIRLGSEASADPS